MVAIDTINQLRQRGQSDADIINNLQQQGISPREINESMAQSQVKQAVADETLNLMQPPQQTQEIAEEPGMQGMQTSLISQQPMQPQAPYPPGALEPPQPGYYEPYSQEQQPPMPTEEYSEEYSQEYPEDQYSQEYGEYPQEQYNLGASTDTISEIASQLISEKTKKTDKTIKALIEVKTLLAVKVEKLDDRLKKIESVIDQLQMSVLRKSSDQEQNIEDIKSEMGQMQESFGKIINPLVDRARQVQKKPRKKTKKKK